MYSKLNLSTDSETNLKVDLIRSESSPHLARNLCLFVGNLIVCHMIATVGLKLVLKLIALTCALVHLDSKSVEDCNRPDKSQGEGRGQRALHDRKHYSVVSRKCYKSNITITVVELAPKV
ncbi:hypothetical protein GQX74_008480 [Glossina fuscipes]|nr:hypothetical protein GQX74_008480 [Glossina fuscipes]